MKTKHKFTLLALVVLGFIGQTAFKVAAPKADFTGSWAINKEKSDFGGWPETARYLAAPTLIKFSQHPGEMIVSFAYDSLAMGDGTYMGVPKSLDTLSFDGKEKPAGLPGFNLFKTLKWSDDGQLLTLLTVQKMPEVKKEDKKESHPIDWMETFSLDSDGKTLRYTGVKKLAEGTLTVKAVFDKK